MTLSLVGLVTIWTVVGSTHKHLNMQPKLSMYVYIRGLIARAFPRQNQKWKTHDFVSISTGPLSSSTHKRYMNFSNQEIKLPEKKFSQFHHSLIHQKMKIKFVWQCVSFHGKRKTEFRKCCFCLFARENKKQLFSEGSKTGNWILIFFLHAPPCSPPSPQVSGYTFICNL